MMTRTFRLPPYSTQLLLGHLSLWLYRVIAVSLDLVSFFPHFLFTFLLFFMLVGGWFYLFNGSVVG